MSVSQNFLSTLDAIVLLLRKCDEREHENGTILGHAERKWSESKVKFGNSRPMTPRPESLMPFALGRRVFNLAHSFIFIYDAVQAFFSSAMQSEIMLFQNLFIEDDEGIDSRDDVRRS